MIGDHAMSSATLEPKTPTRADVVCAFLTRLAERSEHPVVLLGDPRPMTDGAPSDIDLAVGIEDAHGRARMILAAIARLPWPTRLVQVIRHEAHAHYFVVAVDVGGRWELIHPDLTSDYARDGRRFMGFADLAANARELPGVPGPRVPAPRDAATYYVAKRVSKGEVGIEGIRYLRCLLDEDSVGVRHGIQTLLGDDGAGQILDAIAACDVAAFNAAAPVARTALYGRHPPSFADRVGEVRRVLRRVLEPTGASVAVYGVDGSGKGTLIAALSRIVGPAFRSVQSWHLFTLVRPDRAAVPVTDPHRQPARNRLVSAGKVFWYLALAWFRRTPRIAVARRRARLVLLDRDLADLWIDPVRYRFSLSDAALRWAERLGPRPDLMLVLDADVATVQHRSAEIDATTLSRLVQRYRSLGSGPRVCPLDANASAADVAFEAASTVFAWLEERTLRRFDLRRDPPHPSRAEP